MESPKTLHFHTPTYVLQTNNAVYKTYNFAKDLDGEVIEFTPEDRSVTLAKLGAIDANYECYDPRTGELVTISKRGDNLGRRPVIGLGKQVLTSRMHARPISPFYSAMSAKIARAFNQTLKGKLTGAEAAQILEKELRAIVRRNR